MNYFVVVVDDNFTYPNVNSQIISSFYLWKFSKWNCLFVKTSFSLTDKQNCFFDYFLISWILVAFIILHKRSTFKLPKRFKLLFFLLKGD